MTIKNLVEIFTQKIILRKMDYISDQQGIIRRYQRETNGWNTHLENCKRFILESSKSKKKGKVMVLGSGWLLDCPINELAHTFDEVILVDINHPEQIKKKISHLSNVRLLETDLTGGFINYVYHVLKTYKKDFGKTLISEVQSYSYNIPEDIDFVISLNIINQLNILITDYASRTKYFSKKDILEIASIIQQTHLKNLPKNKTCIICDYEEELYNEDDKLIGVNPLIYLHLPVGNFSKKWQWKFDSLMTYRDDTITNLNVVAIDL